MIEVVVADITTMPTDAIVNARNSGLAGAAARARAGVRAHRRMPVRRGKRPHLWAAARRL